jgi:hydroxymethylpyrimidine/phosphomethylpyrimidine kinase
MAPRPLVLVAAGWDPSGAAGLAQDFKVLAAMGVHASGAPTALTVQGLKGVARVEGVDPVLLRQQLFVVFKEQPVAAVKLGLLYSEAQVDVLAELMDAHGFVGMPVVIDPVLGATAGGSLVAEDLLEALKAQLLPRCTVLTPNLAEAAALTGLPLAQRREDLPVQAKALRALGPQSVLLKGGHLGGDQSPDFYLDAFQAVWLDAPRIETRNSRGTGCTLASAIAAGLARGKAPLDACADAKEFLSRALLTSAHDEWPQNPGPLRFS